MKFSVKTLALCAVLAFKKLHPVAVIGLSADADETRAFYTELFAMIDALK